LTFSSDYLAATQLQLAYIKLLLTVNHSLRRMWSSIFFLHRTFDAVLCFSVCVWRLESWLRGRHRLHRGMRRRHSPRWSAILSGSIILGTVYMILAVLAQPLNSFKTVEIKNSGNHKAAYITTTYLTNRYNQQKLHGNSRIASGYTVKKHLSRMIRNRGPC